MLYLLLFEMVAFYVYVLFVSLTVWPPFLECLEVRHLFTHTVTIFETFRAGRRGCNFFSNDAKSLEQEYHCPSVLDMHVHKHHHAGKYGKIVTSHLYTINTCSKLSYWLRPSHVFIYNPDLEIPITLTFVLFWGWLRQYKLIAVYFLLLFHCWLIHIKVL